MSDFTKIIRLGTVEAWRGRRVSVFCKITLRDEALAAAGLNPDADGYRYGTAWQREDIPDDVTAWLQALPATDRQPAWV